jgi:peptidyl-Asp metalloendopeptidase
MTKTTSFRRWVLTVLAILALGGCNRDWDNGRTAPVGAGSAATDIATARDAMGMASGMPGQGPQAISAVGARAPFAALPDRGDLVGYPQERVVRRAGAYTWHRADVSEEHALRAIFDGELRITAPDGQLLAFEYERHVEHPTGDWTWIGRLRDAPPGRQAILTFGAKAVFGNIAQPAAAPLRLAMRDGASWLVETDPALLAGVESQVLRPERPDFLLPPIYTGSLSVPGASGDTVSSSGSPVESSSSTSSSTTTVVDVLVGYTSGFATAQGGDSQARTRINFLIDVGNQGFVNSQVDARVRLVHAMQVSYPDATDNGDTLEKLTGYKSGSGYTTPDPAFTALRNARETYGADLVTLVRKFNTPENDGCGIAWLIGGGLTTITQGHEYFGYSVVGDGIDQGDDGKNYYCRDETMVHEFGHNLGSAHDRETAKGEDGVLDSPDDFGRYTYSFGYKSGPGSGDFYTIMAYGDKRDSAPYQTPYRVFSNPNTTFCGGYPCGTSNDDNARSLRQTIPLIAGFRAEKVQQPDPVGPARNDVNLDGRSDLLWSRPAAGRFVYWLMNGSTITSTRGFDIGSQYVAVGTGDLDGNGIVDIIWRNTSTGATYVWLGTATGGYVARFIYKLAGGWHLAGTGDVNGDGRSDLLWSRPSTGQFVYWLMNGQTITASRSFTIGSQYTAVGTGDLDGNGRVDIIWRNTSTGATYVWLGTTSGGYVARFIYKLAGGWQLAGTGDVNGDGKSDLLWSRPSTGRLVHWLMDGATISKTQSYIVSSDFTAIGTGDLDGNGVVDVVWRNSAGDVHVWLGSGSGYQDQFIYRLKGWSLLP